MPTRILRPGIVESKAINLLSEGSEILYRRLMSIVDDFGRFEADVEVIRARCFARQYERWPTSRIIECLSECSVKHAECDYAPITLYRCGNKKYLQINNFGQRVQSKEHYPAPDSPDATVENGDSPSSRSRSRIRSRDICASDDAQSDREILQIRQPPPTVREAVRQLVAHRGSGNLALLPAFDEPAPDEKTCTPGPERTVESKYNAELVFHSEFWPLRWRPEGKQGALKAFAHHARTRQKADIIIAAVKAQTQYYLDREQLKRHYMSTWLNGKMYEDNPMEVIGQRPSEKPAAAAPDQPAYKPFVDPFEGPEDED